MEKTNSRAHRTPGGRQGFIGLRSPGGRHPHDGARPARARSGGCTAGVPGAWRC